MRREPKLFRIISISIIAIFLSEMPILANPEILNKSVLAPESNISSSPSTPRVLADSKKNQTDIPSAKEKLAETFATQGATLQQVGKKAWHLPRLLIFDMDGVITKEKEYFEKSWAVLIRRIIKNQENANLSDITNDDLSDGRKFRDETKGGILIDRIKLLMEKATKLNSSLSLLSPLSYVDIFINAVRAQITEDYGRNPEDYMSEGVKALLAYLHNFDIPMYIVTANIQSQADWVTSDFLGIRGYFREVIGYPIESKPISKATTILNLIKTNDIEKMECVFITDGYSDVRFGKEVGVTTLGIANDFSNGCRLIDEGVDFMVIHMKALRDLAPELFRPMIHDMNVEAAL